MTLREFLDSSSSHFKPESSTKVSAPDLSSLPFRFQKALKNEIEGVSREESANRLGISRRTLTNHILTARKELGVSREALEELRKEAPSSKALGVHRALSRLFRELGISGGHTAKTYGFNSWRELSESAMEMLYVLPRERRDAVELALNGLKNPEIAGELGLERYQSARLTAYGFRDLKARFHAITGANVPLPRIPRENWATFSTPERREIFTKYVMGFSKEQILESHPILQSVSALHSLTYAFRKHFGLKSNYLWKRRAINKANRVRGKQKEVIKNSLKLVFPDGVPRYVGNQHTEFSLVSQIRILSNELSAHRRTSLMFDLRVYGLTHNEIGLLLRRNKGTSVVNVRRLANKIRAEIEARALRGDEEDLQRSAG